MVRRLEVRFKDGFVDARGESVKRKINSYLKIPIPSAKRIDVYTIDAELAEEQFETIRKKIFCDPITQEASYSPLAQDFDFLIEVRFLPGVKDNVGETSQRAIQDLLKIKFRQGEAVYTSVQYLIKGNLTKEQAERIASELLANEMIEHWRVLDFDTWQKEGVKIIIPKVQIPHKPTVREIDLNVPDEELAKISANRSLALSVEDMLVIRNYFMQPNVIEERRKLGLSKNPTDVELETIAQTQSEHCKHRIFNALIRYKENGKVERIDSLFNTFIKKSAEEIAKNKEWIVSMFWDNSGVAKLNNDWNYCVKCETHNSPSAMDPYGGAITGIVGVYRDPLGTGKGAKIIAGTYGFCTASPFYQGELRPRMHPRRLLDGIVDGVKDGGNKSGVPTPYGLVFFDNSFIGKPLVYVAAIGIMPKAINGEMSHTKKIDDGDLIVMAGNRVGKDGIHGVTEASLEHGSWVTAGHVQIGDPFTQKKMHDFLLEAREKGLYNCITDNGGGGLSSSVGETARMSNGCELHLDRVPLKYEGLDPWEIFLSESQERMTLAVKPENFEELKRLAEKHDVEITNIGKYVNTGRLQIHYNGKIIANLDMDFLHSGFPQYNLEAEWFSKPEEAPQLPQVKNHAELLEEMLSRENIASKEWIERIYDHEVQGGSVIKPFIGMQNDCQSDAAVIKPLLDGKEGLAIAAGLNMKYSKIDAYSMTACNLDEAIRKVLAAGASLNNISLNDNFCWPNSVYDEKKNPDGKIKLAHLVRANKALYEYTTYFGTPCISGKDSMFIDGNIKDSFGKSHKISGLPTLQFTAVAKVDDVEKCVSMDVKDDGDLVYMIGETKDELGASEYYEMLGFVGRNVPHVEKQTALKIYRAVESAMQKNLVKSCHGCYRGGLGVALAQASFAGGKGIEIELSKVPQKNISREDGLLYSESASRFIITVPPAKKEEFEKIFVGIPLACIGKVRNDTQFVIKSKGKETINKDILELKKAWQSTFKDF